MRGRRKIIEETPVKEPVKKTAWTVDVKLLKSLMTPYRISGKVGDVVSVPANIVDELVKAKKVVKA
jgi:hypothetical protein